MLDAQPQLLEVNDNGSPVGARQLAVLHRAAACQDESRPALFWLSGFKSDMGGSKAVALDAYAGEQGLACTRFDYCGHGLSTGNFEEACLSDWLVDAAAVFDRFCPGPTVLVGSSMGGWIALLLALARKSGRIGKVCGLVLVAPAVDFTQELMWDQRFSDEIRAAILRDGFWAQPSAYGDAPYVITRKLIEDGRKHLLLGKQIEPGCPVMILQGAKDPDVPWQHAMRLVHCLPQDDVTVSLVPDGDHRLSRPEDLDLLRKMVGAMLETQHG